MPHWLRDWLTWGVSGWRQFFVFLSVSLAVVAVTGLILLWIVVHILIPLAVAVIIIGVIVIAVHGAGGHAGGGRR